MRLRPPLNMLISLLKTRLTFRDGVKWSLQELQFFSMCWHANMPNLKNDMLIISILLI